LFKFLKITIKKYFRIKNVKFSLILGKELFTIHIFCSINNFLTFVNVEASALAGSRILSFGETLSCGWAMHRRFESGSRFARFTGKKGIGENRVTDGKEHRIADL
jgi:hypothetical protein